MVIVCVPLAMRWMASSCASCPVTSTLPVSPATSSAETAPPAPPRRAVVRRDDGLNVVLRLRQRVFGQALRLLGLPLLGELVGDDLHIAAVDGRLEDVHLAVAQELRVVVGGRAADEDVVTFGHMLEGVFALHLAHLHDLMRDVEVGLRVLN